MKVDRVCNGYIVELPAETNVFATLEEVFEWMLMHYEGRSSCFIGSSYGKVTVRREFEEK